MEADVIDTLAGIAPGSAIDTARRTRRPTAREHAQKSYDSLFTPPDHGGFGPLERFAVAVFVVDDRRDAYRFAETGLPRLVSKRAAMGGPAPKGSVHDLIKAFDVHLGTPDEVIESLRKDTTLERATDLTMQVHSIDPPHSFILRSIELMAEKVAPALGWMRDETASVRRVA